MQDLLAALKVGHVTRVTVALAKEPEDVIADPVRLAAIEAELRRLDGTGSMMVSLLASEVHRITVHGPDGAAGSLVIYNRSMVKSPIDTSVIDGAGPLLRLLGLA